MTEGHDIYAIVYEDKDYGWEEADLHFTGSDSLDDYVAEAKRLVDEGHRNVRVVEYVTVEREVMRL